MSKYIILKDENTSNQYRIGDTNDRATKGTSDYVWALQDM